MSAGDEISKAYKVHGRVQGVGFRWWAQREARRLGLRGMVRNCSDGTVEIAFAGSSDRVTEMEVRLRQGPPAGYVDGLQPVDPPASLPSDFEIVF